VGSYTKRQRLDTLACSDAAALLDGRAELLHVQRILQYIGAERVDEALSLVGERLHQSIRPQAQNVAMALEGSIQRNNVQQWFGGAGRKVVIE
jgi:hypothetical protein